MGKRVYFALAVVAVALVGVIGWQVVKQPDEPVYLGKPLSEWLKDHSRTFKVVPEPYEAIRQAGTNAIPTLLRLLRAKDSALKVKLMRLAERQHVIKVEYTPAEEWNLAAESGFVALGTNAQSAVPALTKIMDQNISPTSRYCAILALGVIGPPAKEAVPSLLRCATDTDTGVRELAIVALGRIHAESDRVVPVLTNALRDPSFAIRLGAAVALGEFGPHASIAVPTLVELLNASDGVVRERATNALEAIDPEAAAKAGLK